MKTLYQNKETQVKVNVHLSQRGVRPGCSLSMILYIVFAEIYLENITQNSSIKGIATSKKERKSLRLSIMQQYT